MCVCACVRVCVCARVCVCMFYIGFFNLQRTTPRQPYKAAGIAAARVAGTTLEASSRSSPSSSSSSTLYAEEHECVRAAAGRARRRHKVRDSIESNGSMHAQERHHRQTRDRATANSHKTESRCPRARQKPAVYVCVRVYTQQPYTATVRYVY